MNFPRCSSVVLIVVLRNSQRVDGWTFTSFHRPGSALMTSKSTWSATDDWNGLSEAESSSGEPLMGNLIQQVDSPETSPSQQEQWLQDTVDAILHVGEHQDLPEPDQSHLPASFEDDMGDEIALLVRCNEQPQTMLVQEGRALLPLTDEELFDPSQLVEFFVEQWVPSKFLDKSLAVVFDMHAKGSPTTHGNKIMDAPSVAAWLQQSLQSTQAIGPHDQRVMSTIASFSSYGTGHLMLEDFKRLYLRAIVGDAGECATQNDIVKRRADALKAVWRDLRNHGISPPREAEQTRLQKELLQPQQLRAPQGTTIMDECELVYDKVGEGKRKSSHALVELASDKKTPLWIHDGEFVFIDEDSCIGCTNCALAAPASFEILSYDGRARSFAQRPKGADIIAAVATCPVDCMHYVSFDELKELETARDEGDGREDHRHFGTSEARGYIERKPLHVQRRESDASHTSSWYHYLKDKCCKSPACPERGCFDCPSYKSGSNPFFQERVRKATHVRAQNFIDLGVADSYRKTADL